MAHCHRLQRKMWKRGKETKEKERKRKEEYKRNILNEETQIDKDEENRERDQKTTV